MSNAHRATTTAARATSAVLALAGVSYAINASAQPGAPPPGEPQAEVPVATPATPAPPAPVPPAPAPAQAQPQLPMPFSPAPVSYPFTVQPKPQPTEPEGPVFSWDPLRFAIAFESRTTWLSDNNAKRLAGRERPAAVGLSAQADVLNPQPDLAVRLDLAWLGNSETSYANDSSLSERLQTHLFSLGIALRYQVLRYLAPFARISGGLGWDKVTVADLHDRQYFAHGTVGAGLALRSPGLRLWQGDHAPLLGLVAHIEGGYVLGSSSDFVLHAHIPSSSDNPIPSSEVRLGQVERNAPYLRVSVGVSFY